MINNNDSREKVISLYQYLQKLYEIKKNNVTSVKDYEKHFLLNELPAYSEENVQYVTVDKRIDSDVLIEVGLPAHSICPELKEEYREYIVTEFNKVTNFKYDVEVGECDNDEALEIINQWLELREAWRSEQRKIAEVRELFQEIYRMYNLIVKQKEEYELILGNGMIMSKNSGVYHTILAEQLNIEFDPVNNILKVTYFDDRLSKLDISFLDNLLDIDKSSLGELRKEADASMFRVLDNENTFIFFNKTINLLTRNGAFIEDEEKAKNTKNNYDYIMSDVPVIFMRKKNSGVSEAIDRIIEDIKNQADIPEHLINIVESTNSNDIDNNNNSINSKPIVYANEEKEILLSKPANNEQVRIIEKIRGQNSVVVQGPPGTGKTHTIANLVGNFLAEGKNVLVTSHTTKALSVVKDKVDESLQDLCVSLLDNNKRDMEKSIGAIGYKIGTKDSYSFESEISKLKINRSNIIDEIKKLRSTALNIKNTEYKAYSYEGKAYSISEISSFVSENKRLDKIKGEIKQIDYFPFKKDDFEFLKMTNDSTSVEEREIKAGIGNIGNLITVNDLDSFLKINFDRDYNGNTISFKKDTMSFIVDGIEMKLINLDKLNKFKSFINNYIRDIESLELSYLGAFFDGIRKSDISLWEVLKNDCIAIYDKNKKYSTDSFEYNIQFDEVATLNLYDSLKEMCSYLETHNKISKLKMMTKKDWQQLEKMITINDSAIKTANECKLVLEKLDIIKARKSLEVKWSKLFANDIKFSDLGDSPEEAGQSYINKAIYYYGIYNTEYIPFTKELEAMGIKSDFSLFEFILKNNDEVNVYLNNVLRKIEDYIELAITYYNICVEYKKYSSLVRTTTEELSKTEVSESLLCKKMMNAIANKDLETYSNCYEEVYIIKNKVEDYNRRVRIISEISDLGEIFALSIQDRSYEIEVDSLEEQWKYKIFSQIYKEVENQNYTEILEMIELKKRELVKVTTKIIEESAWYHLISKVEKDSSKFKALEGWKQTEKKIGKGTGIRAKEYKKEARKLMAQCQSIVPVWIMPISKALESLNPQENKFDVIIVDEASQSDISALAILYLGKKVIVVGDDEQVSPTSLGAGSNVETVNTLISTYISDLPNKHLFTRDTSLYDMALQMNPSSKVVLREHFRCVPEIIKYSNDLCYNGAIIPLKDNSSSKLKPATIVHRVDGTREGDINEVEADEIVSLINACINEDVYKGMSIGVISMLSKQKQVDLINNKILENIDPVEIENRKIICGTPSEFQGDERDVIFLSFVDSNEGEGPLRLSSDRKETKQRYNVAVSRARSQIWAVHSLDINNDLKSDDMRKNLLLYLENASNIENRIEEIEKKSDSPFETSVCTLLSLQGYQYKQQWKVGAFSIDIVALSGDKKIAIECDGERYHSGYDKVQEDMDRQAILERLGWTFIRIRGSEFYSNQEATMQRVYRELESYGIVPISENTQYENSEKEVSELIKEIIRNAKLSLTKDENESN